jgi:transcriptional regulator with XRE-family HTH domain
MKEDKKVEKLQPGKRLQAMRALTGLTQAEFSEVVDIPLMRIKNLEANRARLKDSDFESVCSVFPEFAKWMTYEGDITLDDLKESQNKLCNLIAAKIEAGIIPKGYNLEEKFQAE